METIGEHGREGLPRGIPAEELRIMLGMSPEFCSRYASNSGLTDSTVRWPFLFSRPLMGTKPKSPHDIRRKRVEHP